MNTASEWGIRVKYSFVHMGKQTRKQNERDFCLCSSQTYITQQRPDSETEKTSSGRGSTQDTSTETELLLHLCNFLLQNVKQNVVCVLTNKANVITKCNL